MRYFFSFFLMVLGWAVLSCEGLLDMPDEARYEEKIVVNGTLLANPFIPIDSVWVHTSSRVDEPFAADSNALTGAMVTLLGPDQGGEDFLDTLREDVNLPGLYHIPGGRRAQAGETYTLYVSHPGYPSVEASTTVPGPVYMVNDSVHTDAGTFFGFPDTIVYRPASEEDDFLSPVIFSFDLQIDSTAPPYLVRLINIALEPTRENMILEDDSLKALIYKWNGLGDDEEELELRLLSRRATAFNSTVYDRRYQVSWSQLTFYGPQVFMVIALDESYYNYHKGFLEGPPRDIHYLPESNVVGGYGLFSSANLTPENIHYYYLARP